MTILLAVHIVLMTSSLVATSAMALRAAINRSSPLHAITLNLLATIAGIGCGILLLAQHPIGSKCAILFGYTLIFAATHAFIMRRHKTLGLAES